MKILLPFVGIALIAALSIKSLNQDKGTQFYYTFNVPKSLSSHKSKLIVRFKDASLHDSISRYLENVTAVTSQEWTDNRTVIINCQSSSEQTNLINQFSLDSNVNSAFPMYLMDQDGEVGITDEFLVEFNYRGTGLFLLSFEGVSTYQYPENGQ
jgi:hypothetical protein